MAQVIQQFSAVSRITTLIAGLIAASITLLAPMGYYYVSHQYLARTMVIENEFTASILSGIVANNPKTWRFEEIRVSEILHRRLNKGNLPTVCRVKDMTGALVAEVVVEMPQPVIVVVDEIFDAGVPVARIELTRTLRPLLVNTILIAILSALVGGMVFLVLRLIPMRAVARACQELMRSELRYRSLYNSMREGLGLFEAIRGQDGRMVSFRLVEANPVFLRINGRSLSELRNADGQEIMAGAFHKYLAEIATVMAHDQTFRFENPVVAQNKYYDILIFAPTPDTFAALVEDITERKRTEVNQAKMEIVIRQSQKMQAISTLTNGIAHNFNNILTAIFGFTDLAMTEDDPKKRAEDLEQVRLGAKRAKELVSQMKNFNQATEQEDQPLQVALVINEALKGLRAMIPTTIEIKQNLTSTGMVLADPVQIQQIIMNLCTNAHHAMRETGGTLGVTMEDIEIREQDAGYGELMPGRYLELAVSDTGCGISPEIRERIFDPYFTAKEIGEGTGLGLYVVLGIIKSYHGHIAVQSELGKGSTFQVYLPLLADNAVGPTL